MADLGDVEQGLVGGGGGGDEGGREGGLWAGHRPRKLRKFAQSLNIFYIFDILGSSAMYTGNIVWYGSTKFDQEPRYLKPPFRCLDLIYLIKCKLSKFSQP